MKQNNFRTSLGESIFHNKYKQYPTEDWHQRAMAIVDAVCGYNGGEYQHPLMSKEERDYLTKVITEQKFVPGGRYIYYAGRKKKFYNNCFLLRAEEDTREEWSSLTDRAMSCLMTGGGIGIDYSVLRPSGRVLSKTGGEASGPVPLMHAINEIGANVMQGGSRRSAIYASLDWQHEDVPEFLRVKNWDDMPIPGTDMSVGEAKKKDFNYKAPLDQTNISLNYNDEWLNKTDRHKDATFLANVRQALSTGEPGFSFNFGEKQNETLRNA